MVAEIWVPCLELWRYVLFRTLQVLAEWQLELWSLGANLSCSFCHEHPICIILGAQLVERITT